MSKPAARVNGRFFSPHKLNSSPIARSSCDVIRMEYENPALWLVHLYHVISILDSDWSVRIPAPITTTARLIEET